MGEGGCWVSRSSSVETLRAPVTEHWRGGADPVERLVCKLLGVQRPLTAENGGFSPPVTLEPLPIISPRRCAEFELSAERGALRALVGVPWGHFCGGPGLITRRPGEGGGGVLSSELCSQVCPLGWVPEQMHRRPYLGILSSLDFMGVEHSPHRGLGLGFCGGGSGGCAAACVGEDRRTRSPRGCCAARQAARPL